jgi:hypothetical protein
MAGFASAGRKPWGPEAYPYGRQEADCDAGGGGIERSDVLVVVVIAIGVLVIAATVPVFMVACGRTLRFVVAEAAARGAGDAAAFADPAAVKTLSGQAGDCCKGEQCDEPAQAGEHGEGWHRLLTLPTSFVRRAARHRGKECVDGSVALPRVFPS